MKEQIGLWIDLREMIIVDIGDHGEETKRIESGMEKHVRFSGGLGSGDHSADDQRNRQFIEHLNNYYDEVIPHLRDALARVRPRASSRNVLRIKDLVVTSPVLKQPIR